MDGWRDGKGEREQVTRHFNKITILVRHLPGTFFLFRVGVGEWERWVEVWEGLSVWKGEAPGRVFGSSPQPPAGLRNWQPEGLEESQSPLPSSEDPKKMRKGMCCMARGPPAPVSAPLPVVCVALGESPTAVSLLCLAPKEQCCCNADVPPPATPAHFFSSPVTLVQTLIPRMWKWGGNLPVFLYSSQRIFSV